MIEWNNSYNTGNIIIDQHHKELFRLCNNLNELYENKFLYDKYDKIVEGVEALKDYTKYHFEAEERYMLSVNYKNYTSHKAAHTDFVKKLDDMNYNMIDTDQDNYLLNLISFAVDWLIDHILTIDKLIDSYSDK